ncbi:hypothetical protein PVK06_016465 [Gossypium arboreum]|uniref:Secreted protein n=1 Tax=Gossypium arboreum TaxID=29729 RepID=A0ABR0Q0D7_GOSAR|nr:hypothetical protein PVK06_016465 [Gossypium arboreum]
MLSFDVVFVLVAGAMQRVAGVTVRGVVAEVACVVVCKAATGWPVIRDYSLYGPSMVHLVDKEWPIGDQKRVVSLQVPQSTRVGEHA